VLRRVGAEPGDRVTQTGQRVLQGGEVVGELRIVGVGRDRVGPGGRDDLLRAGEVALDRGGHLGDGGGDLGAEVVGDDLLEDAAEERVVLGQVRLRALVQGPLPPADQRLEHVAADGVVHHVGEQHVLGALAAGEQFVRGLPGALQGLDGDDREGRERDRADPDEGRELHAERAVGPDVARHVRLQKPGADGGQESTVARDYDRTLERLQRKYLKLSESWVPERDLRYTGARSR
jgi:hypothetical protein